MAELSKLVNGVRVPVPPLEQAAMESEWAAQAPSLATRRHLLFQNVDDRAEQVRLRHITGGAGQAMTYDQKAQAAQAYKDAGYVGPVPVLVQAKVAASVGTDNLTAQQAADLILATRDAWLALAAQIEQAREYGKAQIAAAVDWDGAKAAHAAALSALDAL